MSKAFLLDRDGVINPLVFNSMEGVMDSPLTPSQFTLNPGAGEAINRINEMGFLSVIVSNQPAAAKGKTTIDNLIAVDLEMRRKLKSNNAKLDGIYYCFHHPEATNQDYRKHCHCRKPKPGLLLQAAKDLNIDLEWSYLIGDRAIDIEAGTIAGAKTIWIGSNQSNEWKAVNNLYEKPWMVARDLFEAVQIISQKEV